MGEQRQGEEVFRGKLITVRVQSVPRAGGTTARYEIVEHADATAVVAVRQVENAGEAGPQMLVALVRQQRPAIAKATWELPAGLVDPGEEGDLAGAAARELREETGYISRTPLRLLTRVYSSPGFSTEAISLYLATDVELASADAAPDPDEIEQLDWKPLSEAVAMCQRGEIEDSKSVVGILLARDALAGT